MRFFLTGLEKILFFNKRVNQFINQSGQFSTCDIRSAYPTGYNKAAFYREGAAKIMGQGNLYGK
jgi:hypothetical protein